jgi:hypothetical protein
MFGIELMENQRSQRSPSYSSDVYFFLSGCSYAWYTNFYLIRVVQPEGWLKDKE